MLMGPGLYELLRECTARVSIQGMGGYGTGFFVARGLLLTCAHVVQQAQANEKRIGVYWQGSSFEASLMQVAVETDLALLRVDLTTHPTVFLDSDAQSSDSCYSYGYSDEYQNGDPATLTCEGWSGEQHDQLKLKMGQIRPGFSGAPLLNLRTGKVCGIMQRTRDRSTDLGGRAIASSVILRSFLSFMKSSSSSITRINAGLPVNAR